MFTYVCRSEDSLQASVLSTYMSPRDQIQVVSLSGQCLNSLSHLTAKLLKSPALWMNRSMRCTVKTLEASNTSKAFGTQKGGGSLRARPVRCLSFVVSHFLL